MTELPEMTTEEIAAARAEIARERAELGMARAAEIAPEVLASMAAAAPVEDAPAEEWPHAVFEYAGLRLEVRKPDESALVAISMTGVPGLSPQVQMRIFTRFLTNHLSLESFVTVVEAMTDPESGVDIQGLITAMTKLPD